MEQGRGNPKTIIIDERNAVNLVIYYVSYYMSEYRVR